MWSCSTRPKHPRASNFAVHRALKWSFEALATGRWPRSDYMGRRYPRGSGGADRAGKRLARKHTAVLFCCKGDLDHFWKSMQAPSFHSSSPCAHCNADRDQNPWWDGPCQAMSGLDAQQAPGHRCLHRGFGAGHNCLPEDVTWQGFLVQLLQGSVSRGTGVGKGLHA